MVINNLCFVNLPRNEYTLSVPLGLLSLYACLKNTSYEVTLFDFDLMHKRGEISCDDTFCERAVQIVTAPDPDIVAITADCANYPAAMEFIRCLKHAKSDVYIVVGGPHASLAAIATLKAFPKIDCIVIGEGEVTLPRLLDALSNKTNLIEVMGIAFRDGDRISVSPSRDLMPDLNDLPFQLFTDYPVEHYRDLFHKKGLPVTIQMEVGRGCPKLCYFCATAKMWKGKYRCKSPKRVFQEMSLVADNFGITSFEIIHDNIAFNNNYLSEFCAYLSEKESAFTWTCSASTDALSSGLLEMMAQAGCTGVLFGIESGSERMQKIMGKNLNMEHSDRIVRHCIDLGIHVVASFILGFPEETKRDIDLTIRKAVEYSLLGVEIRIGQLSVFPGTYLYEHYFDRLELRQTSPNSGSTSYTFAGQKDLIRQFPEVFSSFYTLPPAHHPEVEISTLLTFSDVMVNNYAQAFENVLFAAGSVGDGPFAIFEEWDRWWKEHYPDKCPDRNSIYLTFDAFLEWYSGKVFSGKRRFLLQESEMKETQMALPGFRAFARR